MFAWIEQRVRAVRNRVRKWRRSPAFDVFLGVFWALVAVELISRFI
jgi:hypothetical protein